jgi:hypothetical protein
MTDNEHRERQRQLEEKKQKLAELRAAKQARQREDGRMSINVDCESFFGAKTLKSK